MRRNGPIAMAIALLLVVAMVREAGAVSCPFPCQGCWIRSDAQVDLVVMDRAQGQVRLVPNIRFSGMARDFALVVPTPSHPSLDLAASDIWSEAAQLTSNLGSRRTSEKGFCGCSGSRNVVSFGAVPDPAADDVIIHERLRVGRFDVTILSSSDAISLVTWLRDNGFEIQAADSLRLAPYVQRNWFFSAMKLDPADPANQMPSYGWNNSINPVLFTYAATDFELPLPLLAINRGYVMPLVLYVVDDHRVTFRGFTTDYANAISPGEFEAIQRSQPALSPFLTPGRFLTRLTANISAPNQVQSSIPLERAPTDDEFRRTIPRYYGALSGELFVLPIALYLWRLRYRRGRAAGGEPQCSSTSFSVTRARDDRSSIM